MTRHHLYARTAEIVSTRAPVLLCLPAMGVPARFYQPMMQSLANATGGPVYTAELRGQGDSAERAERGADFGYREIVEEDLPRWIDHLAFHHPHRRIVLMGHSLGGQLAVLASAALAQRLSALVLVAAGTAHHRAWPASHRAAREAHRARGFARRTAAAVVPRPAVRLRRQPAQAIDARLVVQRLHRPLSHGRQCARRTRTRARAARCAAAGAGAAHGRRPGGPARRARRTAGAPAECAHHAARPRSRARQAARGNATSTGRAIRMRWPRRWPIGSHRCMACVRTNPGLRTSLNPNKKVTPMSWLEIVTLAVLPAFLLLDLLLRAPKGSRSRWWRTRATAVTAVNFWLSLTLGQLYGQWFGDFHLLDGSVLGTAGGAVVGVLVVRVLPLLVPPQRAPLRRAVAHGPPDAPQRRDARRLGRVLPAPARCRASSPACPAWCCSRCSASRPRPARGRPRSSPSAACSSTPMCARRAGSAT